MSTNLVRMKFAAIAAKIETTVGTDVIAGSPASTDWIGSDCEVQFDPQVIDLPEYNGSLDRTAAQIGGLRPRLRLRFPLRGSGAAATAPEWGKLMRCCTFAETETASAVGAPTAATAGTTTTVTAQAPFAATAQLYRGMPLLLAGDQTGTTGIVDYTAGRVITVGETRTAMTTSTTLQIPINWRYAPTSDESVYKTATIYFYADNFLWTFAGASGTVSLELTTGGVGFITFEMRAMMGTKSSTALPAAAATAANTRVLVVPPRFVNGKMQLNKALAQVRTLRIDAGVNVTLPDDPESSEGYGAGVPVERAIGGTMDPLMNTSNGAALFTAFKNGTQMSLMAILGSTAGNRFVAICPLVKNVAMDPTNRDGLAAHGMTFQADGADSGFFLTQF
jgi:predicted Rdx family selenoprotein